MDDDDWSLPGYDVQGRLGDGTGEDLWRGRDRASGDVVVLSRLPEDATPATVRAWRQQASRQAQVACPHLVRLRAVVEQGGRAVLVRDHAAGGRLAALVARRRVLEPGEVVTLGIALADALAALHDAGLVHGDVSADTVVFRRDGMPLLDASAAPGASADAAAADVVALAALCTGLAGPQAPPELATVLSAGRAGDLDASAFGAALRRTCPPAPVQRGGAPPGQARQPADERGPRHAAVRAPRRRPSSAAVSSVGVVLLLLAGALGGWWSARGGAAEPARPVPAVPAPAASAPTSAGEWAAVLGRLDAARATAFAQADDALLASVWASGSGGLPGDRRLVRALAVQGLTAHDLRHDVREIRVLAPRRGGRGSASSTSSPRTRCGTPRAASSAGAAAAASRRTSWTCAGPPAAGAWSTSGRTESGRYSDARRAVSRSAWA